MWNSEQHNFRVTVNLKRDLSQSIPLLPNWAIEFFHFFRPKLSQAQYNNWGTPASSNIPCLPRAGSRLRLLSSFCMAHIFPPAPWLFAALPYFPTRHELIKRTSESHWVLWWCSSQTVGPPRTQVWSLHAVISASHKPFQGRMKTLSRNILGGLWLGRKSTRGGIETWDTVAWHMKVTGATSSLLRNPEKIKC